MNAFSEYFFFISLYLHTVGFISIFANVYVCIYIHMYPYNHTPPQKKLYDKTRFLLEKYT